MEEGAPRAGITARPIALRAFTELVSKSKWEPGKWLDPIWPDWLVVLDTETTTDRLQALLFGCFRYYRLQGGIYLPVQEGLFYADDLPQRDPDGFRCLREYVLNHRAEVCKDVRHDPELYLWSQTRFLNEVLWKTAYEHRARVVGFNLPFDLTRIAKAGKARKGRHRRWFSLALWGFESEGEWKDNPNRPRLWIESREKSAKIQFSRPKNRDEHMKVPPDGPEPDDEYTFRGDFLDLAPFAYGLTGRVHGLASACDAFGVSDGKQPVAEHGRITPEYIDYCRQDVAATAALMHALKAEFDSHGLDDSPTRVVSPASIAKGALGAMGLEHPLAKFDSVSKETLAKTMATFFGGRAETRIRGTPVPIVYLDFMSQYPAVASLLDISGKLFSEKLNVVDATDSVRELLRSLTLDSCLDPELWKRFAFFAEIEPDGDIVPVRAQYDLHNRSRSIGVNPLHAHDPAETVWFAGPDLVASTLLTGRAPKIVRALALDAEGVQVGLSEITVRGRITVDPTKDDLFRTLIEERKALAQLGLDKSELDRLALALKIFANSGAYGILVQINRLTEQDGSKVRVYTADGDFEAETNHPERPGPFCFPPFGSLISSGGRLLLAMVERMIADRGGVHAFCDTDSKAIVATESGGLIPCEGGSEVMLDGRSAVRALPWVQVNEIRDAFKALNPFRKGPAAEVSLLELEKENFTDQKVKKRREIWFLGISAKRYVLYWRNDLGEIEIIKPSEHGLGHLMDPSGKGRRPDGTPIWIEEVWRYIISWYAGDNPEEPDFFNTPAVSRETVSTPHLHKAFKSFNEGRRFQDTIKPFNFLICASPDGFVPADERREKYSLVAPYESDPKKWKTAKWVNPHSRREYRVTTDWDGSARCVPVKSIRHVVQEYLYRPEHKSLGADGEPCGRETRGLLSRRPVLMMWKDWIGKESNELEAVEAGLNRDLDDVQPEWAGPKQDHWERIVLPILRTLDTEEVAQRTGVSRRMIQMVLMGARQPSTTHQRLLRNIVLCRLSDER